MRGWELLVVAVAACYRPSADASCVIACDDLASDSPRAPCPTDLICASSGYCVEDPGTACEPRRDPIAGTPFSDPVPFLQTPNEDDDPSLTADLLELYLLSNTDLYAATRATTTDVWSPAAIDELNTTLTEARPCVSLDGLTIYFARRAGVDVDGKQLPFDIYVSTRAARGDKWNPPVPVIGDINTPDNELPGWVSPDGLTMLFESFPEASPRDLFIARRSDRDAAFVREAPLRINSEEFNEGSGWFNATGTILVFDSNRGGTTAIWEAFRDGDTWTAVPHPELDSTVVDGNPWLSPDGRTIVYSSNARAPNSNDDLYISTRE